MTEKEAKENLFHLIHINTYLDLNKEEFKIENETLIKWSESIDTVIQALEQKDKEIQKLKEKWNKDTHTLQNQLDLANADNIEKDKMIKAMAKYLNSTDIDEDICKTVSKEFDCTLYQNENFCINCIIGYFKEEVRKENV